MPEDFEQRLVAFAERTLRIRAHCTGEDATRIYLVMPFLELLGYDVSDPSVIVPEHGDEIDFAVMIDRQPGIIVEATGTAQPLSGTYGRLRACYDAHESVGVGIATNGSVFEAYIDIDQPHRLDAQPFLRLDMAEIAARRVSSDAIALLAMLRPEAYNRDAIAERAYVLGLRERIKSAVLDEFREPSEALCRLLLDRLGIKAPRTAVIDQHYRPIVHAAIEQAIVVPVLAALRKTQAPERAVTADVGESKGAAERPRIVTGLGDRIGDEVVAFGRAMRRRA